MKPIVIAGTSTGVGKTIVSAIFLELLGATYWKPVQTGDERDTDTVRQLVANPSCRFLTERFHLKMPASPHIAAETEKITIRKEDLLLPETNGNLLIEMAGGVLVPLNNEGLLSVDMIAHWKADVILVSLSYLGSINHTLLSIEALQKRNIRILGLVYNGEPIQGTKEIIHHISKLPVLLTLQQEQYMSADVISHYAQKIIWNQ